MFELHVRQCPASRGDEDRQVGGALPYERRLEVDAYFSFPLFRSVDRLASAVGTPALRRRPWLKLLIVGALMIGVALWPNGCIHPRVEPSFSGGESDTLIASFIASFAANTTARLSSGSLLSFVGYFWLSLKIALFLGLLWWLPKLAIPRRPIFRLRIYLLHPETPAPFPTPIFKRSRYIDIALRMTDPDMWRDFKPDVPTLTYRTDRYGMLPPDVSRDLFSLCLRLLRYSFLSRLPRSSQSTTVGEAKVSIVKSHTPSPGTSEHAQPSPKVPAPAADPSPAEQAEYAFRLAIYAHLLQLRLYLGLVLSVVLYGLLFGLGATSKILVVILGLAWLSVSIVLMLKQVRAFSRWLHKNDKEPWPPAYELDDERNWRYIWPDFFKQSSDAEVGIGHDRLLAVAVTVLFALYLTLLQVIV